MKPLNLQETSLGIELGSTRIKAVIIDKDSRVIAKSVFEWENVFEDNYWTYSLEDVWIGVQSCIKDLKTDLNKKYNIRLDTFGSIGISAMMHGYLVFDSEDQQLVRFRTWRNNNAAEAAEELTEHFNYNIPNRWSIAHLLQAIKDEESHIHDISFITTLAGYVHWKLTGEKVLGVGEASGMLPIDLETNKFNLSMIQTFDELIKDVQVPWKLNEILPEVKVAGEFSGYLSVEGARLLDPTGDLKAGILFCAPEGDAGTGMIATNSIKRNTGNISAGTSIFSMVVLEKELSRVYKEIDLVTTPVGDLVAMVHCNNGTSEINEWVNMFSEFGTLIGSSISKNELFELLYNESLKGDDNCEGLVVYNYFSGEDITDVKEGRPLLVRNMGSKLHLPTFIKAHLYSILTTLKIGMNILVIDEKVRLDSVCGHGGIFNTKGVMQKYMASALNTPVTVMTSAGEGGAWGMSVLAQYALAKEEGESLQEYLDKKVFVENNDIVEYPNAELAKGIENYIQRFEAALPLERSASKYVK